jgi:ABC-type antimicrobial peptide transport system permease subunit
MTLFAVFAAAALVLAVIGVAGVASQAARARTREVGIRLALGATSAGVLGTLAGRPARFALVGLGAGLAFSLAGGRAIEAQLYGVDPRDPLTFGAVAIVIGLVALAATVWPTWRAARVDPAVVLRSS